jgi:hypothetical protein
VPATPAIVVTASPGSAAAAPTFTVNAPNAGALSTRDTLIDATQLTFVTRADRVVTESYRTSTGKPRVLTTIVSLEAILLSIFVLMAQNRSARIDQLRQEFDLQINLIAESELTKLLSLVAKIAEKQGIDVASDRDLQEMLAPTNVEKIERVLERQLADSRAPMLSKAPPTQTSA